MSDDAIGYGKPPERSRFRKGLSGNPKGRPKRKPLALGDIVDKVLNAPGEYREHGRKRTAPRRELAFRTHLKRAVGGDVKSAVALLKIRAHAEKFGKSSVHKIQVTDWLPDYPGQNAEEKTRAMALKADAAAAEWWPSSDEQSKSAER